MLFVGEEGDLTGTLSAKDLKGALVDFYALILPVSEFVGMVRRETTTRDTPPLINVRNPLAIHLHIFEIWLN